MAADWDPWLLVPRPVRRLPADLAAVIALVLVTNVVVLAPVIRETPLRVIFGLPLVLFLPGYAFSAALFPEHGESPPEGDVADAGSRRGIDGIERVALSFGLSIAVVPLIGLVLNFTPWGIRLVPVLVSVSGVTLAASGVAAIRRWELPEDERFVVPYKEWLGAARKELLRPSSRTDAALNVLLVVSILLAVASVTYAVTVPQEGEAFTEFYLLTRDDGELVAAGYPTEFVVGERKPVVIGIVNHEHETMQYTVVVALQRARVTNNSTTVFEEDELRRFRARVRHNETWMTTYNVSPTLTGTRLRLVFLLYRNDPPPAPSVESAYRELHLWINVSTRN